MAMAKVLLLLLALVLPSVVPLPESELFQYGTGQHLPNDDDVSSHEVHLDVPIVFYGTEYRSIYVNDNGLLSFLTEVPSFFNAQFPLTYPIIAPLYSDVDTRGSGRVYYRETQAPELLERATRELRNHFSAAALFEARSLFIVTWDEVGHYDRGTEKVNTFQVVIASDGRDSFAYFLYPERSVQWIRGTGKNPNLPDARAQAGFMAGDGRLYTLRGSGTEQARNLDRMSNAGKAGLWLFHLGSDVLPPDLESSQKPEGRGTCSNTLLPCPHHSLCVDDLEGHGFCCVCKEGYFGNGRNCVEKNSPQRMNGKVSGFLNDVSLDEADLHAYVVTEDGRTYTAVSRVPDVAGSDLQVLFPLGGVVGWLFAVSRSGAPNGFSVTGGAFNRSAEMDFPGTGHHVLIEETFLGPDVFNYMRVRVKVRGSVPTVPAGAKIELSDYEEEYTRVSSGVIRSRSSRSYKLEGGGLEVPFTLDQTITFEECVPPMASTRLKVARNFVIYDANERIVRYAMTNKISPLTAGDPCAEAGQCPSNSHCVADGDSYRCVCAQGHQFLYGEEGDTCVDVDECALGRDNCHVFAECTNVPGSFHCRCGPGYTGDGIDCQRRQTCADLICDPHAECVEEQGPQRLPTCRCRQGYTGDGIICRVTDQDDCMQNNYCDPRAECVYNHVDQRHECRCRPGYAGNGIVCVEDSCDVSQNCSPDGDCLFDVEGGAYYCACKPGFSGDGYVCLPEDECGHCHLNAHCTYDSQTQRHRCLCNTGFEGDGRNCIRIQEEEGCDDACSPHARCVQDEFFGKYECHCNEGFEGDGLTCRPVDECSNADHCDRNAQCVFEGTRYRCRCNTGYRGDGRTCEREPCETCHPRARCLYDPESRGYRCQCAAGLQGDGVLECRSCVDDHLMCDRNAECLPTGICRCLRGYVGDGLTCQESRGGHLVMAHGMSLLEIPSRPTKNDPGHLLLMEPNQTPVGLTTDCQRGRLYWADASLRLIRSANFDGSDVETLLSEDMQSPEGVAVDWLARTIYWTDSGKDTIEVASLEQNFRKVLISEDLDNPRGIAVHPALGKLYWSDWRRSAPKIEMANMDGTERADLVSHNLGLPNMIVIDYERSNLCWSDSGQGRIECIALNGQSRRVIYTPAAYPFGIAIHEGFIYWTDWEIKFLHRVDINGGEAEPLEIPAGGSGRMYGLVSLPSYCPSIGSACATENGGCRYLCLPSGRGGRTCACPDIVEGETIGFECDNK